MPWTRRARVFWPLLATLLLVDCSTKEWAVRNLPPEHVPHAVVGDVVRFTLAFNPDSAMSLWVGPWSRVVLSAAALLVLLILGRLYRRTPPTARLRAAALALVIGGALGNLLERLLSRRGVTDFIDLGLGRARFYTFNVADLGITLGASLLLLALWREGERSVRE